MGTTSFAHETEDWFEIYNIIIQAYDIDVGNCNISHDAWARLLADAICYPLLTKCSIIDDHREAFSKRLE